MTETELRLAGGEQAFLYIPDGGGPVPGIVLLHERYGLVQHTLDLGAKFARAGIAAVTPDYFAHATADLEAVKRGEIAADEPDEDAARVTNLALNVLKAHPRVDNTKLALMGVCHSGRFPLLVGADRHDLAALVVFYGAANALHSSSKLRPRPMPDMIRDITAPALLVFAEGDHGHSVDHVLDFRRCFEDHRKSYRLRIVGDAPHGFMNDTMPGRYRPRQTEFAWDTLMTFLRDVFNGRFPTPGRVDWDCQSSISQDYDFSKNARFD